MKNSKKILSLMALLILCGRESYSGIQNNKVVGEQGQWKQIGDNQTVTINGESHTKEYNDGGLITRIEGNSDITINGGLKYDIKSSIDNSTGKKRYLDTIIVDGSPLGSPKITGDKLDIKFETTNLSLDNYINAFEIENGADIKIKDINLDLKSTNSSANKYDITAIYLGGGYEKTLPGSTGSKVWVSYPDRESKLVTENVDIKINNTADAVEDAEILGVVLSRDSGKNKTEKVYFESTGNFNLKINDDNTKLKQYYNLVDGEGVMNALVVSGEDTKMVLNNSNIEIKSPLSSSTSYRYNSAILIGDNNISEDRQDDTEEELEKIGKRKSGTLESKGKMILNTLNAEGLVPINLIGIESELKADFENSSAQIDAPHTVIRYRGSWYKNSVEGKDQVVSFKNAKISSESGRIIEVDSGVKNATFNLSGKESLAKPKDGEFLFVEGGNEHNNDKASEITLNINDGASIVGDINRRSDFSKIVVNLDKNGIWKLDRPNSTDRISRISELNIKNGSIFDLGDGRNKKLNVDDANYEENFNDNKTDDKYGLGYYRSNGVQTGRGRVKVLNDGGIISLSNKNYRDSLIIQGDYEGKNNAQIKMNTLWNKDGDRAGTNSQTDVIYINGKVTGVTRIIPVSIVNKKENFIDGDVEKVSAEINTKPVIHAENAKVGAFVGKAQTTGAGEVQLTSRTDSEGIARKFYWTLNINNTDGSSSNIDSTPDSNQNQGTTNSKAEFIPIYAAVTPAYINIGKVNRDLGYSTLATLHERRGENDIKSPNKAQAWARIIGKKTKDYGKNRFDINTDIYGVQAGYDFSVKVDENGKRNTGVYFANLTASSDFFDRYRAENGVIVSDKYTGKVKTRDFSLGLTTTKYYNNGLYLDLVGQLSFIKNKFNSRDDVKANQRGTSLALSAETGRTHKITENFTLEPQVQLIYQNTRLKDFNDGLREVHYGSDSAFRGRIGLRGTFNKDKATDTTSFYTLANIWHDFNGSIKANIGQDRVEEKYSKNIWEIGLGMQIPVTNSAYIYSDMRYEKSSKSSPKHKGYRGTLGFKYSF